MTPTAFDTLKYANSLKAVGVPDKQAEAQASVLAEALAVNLNDLATKEDLQAGLRETELRFNAKIDGLAARIDGQITLVKWMIGVVITLCVGLMIRLFFVRISS